MWTSDVPKVKAIVNALSDDYSRRIIGATISKAKSPEEISEQEGIPVSTCYRRIHDLLDLSIIYVDRIELTNGKKLVQYKSSYKDILVKFENNGELSVDLIPNSRNSPTDKLTDMWDAIRGDNEKSRTETEVTKDCDLCQSNNVECRIFVTGDSKSYLSVCAECERKMHERNTIRSIERLAQERLSAQSRAQMS